MLLPPPPVLEGPRGSNPRAWIGTAQPSGDYSPQRQAPRVLADLTNSTRKKMERSNDDNSGGPLGSVTIRSPDFNEVASALQSRRMRRNVRRSEDREKSTSPYSPYKSTVVPPPPPLLAILAMQQQQQQRPRPHEPADGTISSTTVEEAAITAAPPPLLAPHGRGAHRMDAIPQPPPTACTSNSNMIEERAGGGVEPQRGAATQKAVLTKYHFLKNFAVKPKTPSSKEKAQRRAAGRRGNERRGEISPLPVAPPNPPPIIALAQQCVQAERSLHRPQHNPVPLPDPQGNYHRTIGGLSDRPTVVLSPTPRLVAKQHLLPTKRCGPTLVSILAPQPSTPPTAISSDIASQHHRRGGTQLAAVGGGGGVVVAKRTFPAPAAAPKEVARSLMDDLEEDAVVPPLTAGMIDFFDDQDDGEACADAVCSPDECQPTPIRNNDFITPRFGSVASGAPTHEPTSSELGSHERAECGPSSFVLPSPTTLGSTDPATQASMGTPRSVASTAEGAVFDLLDFEDEVSPMTDEDDVAQSDVDGDSAAAVGHQGNLCRFFEAARLTSDTAALKAQLLEQDHTRVGRLLQQEANATLLSALISDPAMCALLMALWHTKALQAIQVCQETKTALMFLYGYNASVAIPVALPLLEAHGRRLLLMRRDLFMRGAVRKFVRLMPRNGKRSSSSTVGSTEGIALERLKSNGFESFENRHQRYRQRIPKRAPPPFADELRRNAMCDEAPGTDQEDCEQDGIGDPPSLSAPKVVHRTVAAKGRDDEDDFCSW